MKISEVTNYQSTADRSPSASSSDLETRTTSVSETLLSPNQGSQIHLRTMNTEQRKKYACAMFFRAANKGTQTIDTMMRSAFSTLSGVQLSGILNSQTASKVKTYAYILASTPEKWVLFDQDIDVKGPPYALKNSLDAILSVPLDKMTYAAAAGWFLSHTLSPRIQRYLTSKEEMYMRQVIEIQNQEAREIAPSKSKPSTVSQRISSLIEYVMPLLFDATQTALFLRFLERAGSSMGFTSQEQPLDIKMGDHYSLALEIYYQVVGTEIDLIAGEKPVSDATLYILLAVGIMLYATQAWCNFHHDLQSKEKEATPNDLHGFV